MHLPSSIEVNINAIPLYPYRSMEMSVLFVYGSNYQRQVNNNVLSKLKIFALSWMNLFVILAAILLTYIYRWTRISCDGFISALINVLVIFTGGARLRMNHIFERWFFIIVSIGAFFFDGDFTWTNSVPILFTLSSKYQNIPTVGRNKSTNLFRLCAQKRSRSGYWYVEVRFQ